MRMRGYQQAHRVHEPKDKRMGGCRYGSKHTRAWGYEDVRMQGYKQVHEYKNIRMRGFKDITSQTYQTFRLLVGYM